MQFPIQPSNASEILLICTSKQPIFEALHCSEILVLSLCYFPVSMLINHQTELK
uniref:Uncharacterized protein n=1 Tax=virus sp. ctML55 TaxID=2827627 RepID=A0A8S5RIC4_9VIRU|nr:MAG TPA: hypothetical protein [virus sp. ctML55]